MAKNHRPALSTAAQALAHLGLSLQRLSMIDLLQTVADLGKSVTPGDPEASV